MGFGGGSRSGGGLDGLKRCANYGGVACSYRFTNFGLRVEAVKVRDVGTVGDL
jgi:hypothetical protein